MARENSESLRFGPLGTSWAHLCIDMQCMFAQRTEWHTPWLERVLPNVIQLVRISPPRTIFTRFIPPHSSTDADGTWMRYFQRWSSMTRERLPLEMIELVPELRSFVPPAKIEDKQVMSAWAGSLHTKLNIAGVDTLIISGAETEVCVLATVMGAIDRGYRVIIVCDAVCSGADSTHDAMLEIYRSRFGMQVETVTTADLLSAVANGDLER